MCYLGIIFPFFSFMVVINNIHEEPIITPSTKPDINPKILQTVADNDVHVTKPGIDKDFTVCIIFMLIDNYFKCS